MLSKQEIFDRLSYEDALKWEKFLYALEAEISKLAIVGVGLDPDNGIRKVVVGSSRDKRFIVRKVFRSVFGREEEAIFEGHRATFIVSR